MVDKVDDLALDAFNKARFAVINAFESQGQKCFVQFLLNIRGNRLFQRYFAQSNLFGMYSSFFKFLPDNQFATVANHILNIENRVAHES